MPVLAIGLDAAEWHLIQDWAQAGVLPALQSVMERGRVGELASDATRFAGGVWPSFYTAETVARHGIYHNKIWRHEHMRAEVAHESWLPARPFWEALAAEGRTVCVVDVPMTLGAPRPLDGCQVYGWGTHDLITRGAWPPELWERLVRRFGPPATPVESFGPQSRRALRRLGQTLVRATAQLTDLALHLLGARPWDLFLAVLGAAHRGGHYLWPGPGDQNPEGFQGLQTVYRACDRAVGRLLEAWGDRGPVLIFALHGMGPNPGWADVADGLVGYLQQGLAGARPPRGWLYRLRQGLPWPLIRQVTRRLPQGLRDRLVGLWSAGMYDWSQTPFFPLPMDHAGYLRVNLRGREPQGVVAPGEAYRELCHRLRGALLGLQTPEGAPVVRAVHLQEELGAPGDPFRERLPDLVVEWGDRPAAACPVVQAAGLGELRLPGGPPPSGRTGNHSGRGWFAAAGSGIAAGPPIRGAGIRDLAPTLTAWLGVPMGAGVAGRAIAPLMPGGGGAGPSPGGRSGG